MTALPVTFKSLAKSMKTLLHFADSYLKWKPGVVWAVVVEVSNANVSSLYCRRCELQGHYKIEISVSLSCKRCELEDAISL